MYKIGMNGGTNQVFESSLVTPIYTVSGIGESSFAFDMNACMDYGSGNYVYVGGALWMKVNGGQWQHVDMPSYTDRQYSYASATYTVNDGLEIWTRVHCNTNDWGSYEVDLSDYKGDDVQFKFAFGGRFSDSNSGGISTMSVSRWVTSANQERGPAQASQSLVKMHSTGES